MFTVRSLHGAAYQKVLVHRTMVRLLIFIETVLLIRLLTCISAMHRRLSIFQSFSVGLYINSLIFNYFVNLIYWSILIIYLFSYVVNSMNIIIIMTFQMM